MLNAIIVGVGSIRPMRYDDIAHHIGPLTLRERIGQPIARLGRWL